MKIVLKYICPLVVIFGIFSSTTFALDSVAQKKIETAYKKISIQLQKNQTKKQFLSSLQKIETVLSNYANTPRITSKNEEIFSQLQALNNEEIFTVTRELETREGKDFFKKYKNLDIFTHKIYNQDLLSKENGVWYTYVYQNYYKLSNLRAVDSHVLKENGLNPKTTLAIYSDNSVIFVSNYKKLRLVNDELLLGVAGKKSVLELLKKYVYRTGKNENLDGDIQAIRMLSHKLAKGKVRADEKIEIMYDYILKNIDYKIDYNIDNAAPFSGLKTFRSKTGVCEGYVELFKFLLAFQGIQVDFIGGDVITAEDFGQIGHAWARIGNYYYDPTFDDPIGLSVTRTKHQYMFYKLPKDLFYSNRFDDGMTPTYVKESSVEKRKLLAAQRLEIAARRYKNSHYNILNELRFRQKSGITIGKQLDIGDIKKAVLATYYSKNLETVEVGGKKKYINKIQYFQLEDNPELLEGFLFQMNYDMSDFILLIDTDDSGNTKYYVSNDYAFR